MTLRTLNPPSRGGLAATTANGAAWAAILAAGIGCCAFGLFTDLSEASARAGAMLNWYNPAGSLSGVAGCAIATWAIAWAGLAAAWKNRRVATPGRIMLLTVVLVIAGLLATFPPFYSMFARN